MSPHRRPERHLRRRHGRARHRSASSARAARCCTAVLDWSAARERRLQRRSSRSARCSTSAGATSSTTWATTRTPTSIVIYMETIGDARAFLSAAREVALTKPIIVIKPGRTEPGGQGRRLAHRLADRLRRGPGRRLPARRRAARRHDRRPVRHGRGAGQAAPARGPAPDDRDQRRRARRARHRRPDRGRRRADATCRRRRWTRSTRSCPPPGATTTRSTSSATPRPSATPRRSRSPPHDPNSDGLLVILTPAGDDRPDRAPPSSSSRYAQIDGKPVLASWMGGADVAAGRGDPAARPASRPSTTPTPPRAMFNYMWRYSRQPARAVRDARRLPDDAERGAWTASAADGDHRDGPRRGPHAADRGRVEAAAGGLRHPDHRDRASPPPPTRRSRRPTTIGYPVVAQALLATPSPTRPTSAACSSTWPTPTAVRERVRRRSEPSVTEKARRRALRGRHGPADDQAATATS